MAAAEERRLEIDHDKKARVKKVEKKREMYLDMLRKIAERKFHFEDFDAILGWASKQTK